MRVAFRKRRVEGLDEWAVILEDKGTMIADGAPRIDRLLGLSRSMRSALDDQFQGVVSGRRR
jgi:ATP-dependent RNA circularization protein (DNA/RNA ligase family)